jgi:flavin-dependent dehydrogenase
MPNRADVVVVGGGPAGLAAAIAARLHGFDVTVVERRHPPIDKACGEGIMPDGVELLGRLGVDVAAGESVPFDGIEFIENGVRARARFIGRAGLGVRRTVLHAALARRAAEIGVDLRWGCVMRGLRPDGVALDAGPLAARWVIGADGIHSRVRRALGLDRSPTCERLGLRRHYAVMPWSRCVEVYFEHRSEAYVTPVGPEMVCVAILTSDRSDRFDHALRRFPDLEPRLRGARPLSAALGAVTVFRRPRRVVKGRVALLGDAAGSVDAITGEGITLALHQAMLLSRCLAIGRLDAYEAAYHRLMRLANRMTTFMLAVNDSRLLRRVTMRVLSGLPWTFSRLLATHTRSRPRSHAGALAPRPLSAPRTS